MQETQNTKVVQDAYAAFGRGDIPGILNLLADNVSWQGVYGAGPHVPMAGKRRGKAAVDEFFKLVAVHETFSSFEPREFVASGNKVVALGHYSGKTSSGKTFDADFAMVFTVENGKVTAFQEFTDSAAINAAHAA
jgi:uncharacterized protein